MSEENIPIQEIIKVVRRNIVMATAIVLFTSIAITALAFVLPKSYRANAVLNIQASYFNNPLVNDLISEVHDPSELTAQRTSLLRFALNDTFIESLGDTYQLFKYSKGHKFRNLEIQLLRSRIDYYSMSRTSFNIATTAHDPQVVAAMTKDIVQQMILTLIDERRKKLMRIRDAVRENVTVLGKNLKGVPSVDNIFAAQREELEEIGAKIMLLKSQYSANHPEVIKLEIKARSLRALLKDSGADTSKAASQASVTLNAARQPTEDVFQDLTKKLSYLNVVLEMEKDPANVSYLSVIEHPAVPTSVTFPKKRVFLMIGLVIGVLFALAASVVAELRRGTFLSPQHAAKRIDIPFLGELVPMLNANEVRLLEGPGPDAVPRRLPAPRSVGV